MSRRNYKHYAHVAANYCDGDHQFFVHRQRIDVEPIIIKSPLEESNEKMAIMDEQLKEQAKQIEYLQRTLQAAEEQLRQQNQTIQEQATFVRENNEFIEAQRLNVEQLTNQLNASLITNAAVSQELESLQNQLALADQAVLTRNQEILRIQQAYDEQLQSQQEEINNLQERVQEQQHLQQSDQIVPVPGAAVELQCDHEQLITELRNEVKRLNQEINEWQLQHQKDQAIVQELQETLPRISHPTNFQPDNRLTVNNLRRIPQANSVYYHPYAVSKIDIFFI